MYASLEDLYELGQVVVLHLPEGDKTVHFSFISGNSAIMSDGTVINCDSQVNFTLKKDEKVAEDKIVTPEAQIRYDEFMTRTTESD